MKSDSLSLKCCWLASHYVCCLAPWIARSGGLVADLATPPEQNIEDLERFIAFLRSRDTLFT